MKLLKEKFSPQDLVGVCDKFWFTMDNQSYLFKAPDSNTNSHIAEVLACAVYKKIGFNYFINYELAKTADGVEGTICSKFNPPNTKTTFDLINIIYSNCIDENWEECKGFATRKDEFNYEFDFEELEDFYYTRFENQETQYNSCVEFIDNEVKKYCTRRNINCDFDKLHDFFTETFIIDFFTANRDRNWTNMNFALLQNGENHSLIPFPLFDNGNIFTMQIQYPTFCEYLKDKKIYTCLGYSNAGAENESLAEHKIYKQGGILASDIWELTKSDKKYKDLVDKLTSLNLPEIFAELEQQEGVAIDNLNKMQIEDAYNFRLGIYKDFLKNIKLMAKRKKIDLEK